MPYNMTLGQLRASCQKRAVRVGDLQLDSLDYNELITEYYGTMHALVVEKGGRFFESSTTLTTTGALTYPLPADLMTILTVQPMINGVPGLPLEGPVAVQHDRNGGPPVGAPAARWYSLIGNTIGLFPIPSSGQPYLIRYVPQPTDYSQAMDSTVIDLLTIYGRKFVVWGVASVAQTLGGENQERAMLEFQNAQKEVEFWACQHAITEPMVRPVDEREMYGGYFGNYPRFIR